MADETDAATERRDGRTGRLGGLLSARLAVVASILAIGAALQDTARGVAEDAEPAFYGVLVFALAATAASAALLRRSREDSFGVVQIAIDLVLVSGLVLATGRSDSVFSIGFALITIYASLLFEARGAIATATAGAVAYAAVLFGPAEGWLPAWGGSPGSFDETVAVWGVHAGALLLVAFLSGLLSQELQRAGQALDRRTSDLARLRHFHQRTIESLTSGVLTTDATGHITSFNPEAERITGLPRQDVLERLLENVVPGAAAAAFDEGGGRRRARIRFRNRRGEERHLGVAGSRLRTDEPSEDGHVLIFQDVTSVVEMEEELRLSERLAAVGQMAADMAHELRNPLAAILGSIQILDAGGDDDPEQKRLVEIVHRETGRLDALLRDFLQFARPAAPRPHPLMLRPVVEETVELFGRSQAGDVTIEFDVPPNVRIRVDPAQLRQLLWNLFLNGAQAMPSGGTLRIEAREMERREAQGNSGSGRNPTAGAGIPAVEIAVADTGVGIAPEVRERMFDPFFTTRSEGSGLGLATVLRIVESHGGTLRVDSRVGEGTTFRIQLPQAEGDA